MPIRALLRFCKTDVLRRARRNYSPRCGSPLRAAVASLRRSPALRAVVDRFAGSKTGRTEGACRVGAMDGAHQPISGVQIPCECRIRKRALPDGRTLFRIWRARRDYSPRCGSPCGPSSLCSDVPPRCARWSIPLRGSHPFGRRNEKPT